MYYLNEETISSSYIVPFTLGSKENFVKPFVTEIEENFIGKKREIEEKIKETILLAEKEYDLKIEEYIDRVKLAENNLKKEICDSLSVEYTSVVDDFFLLAKYFLINGDYIDNFLKNMHEEMYGYLDDMKEHIQEITTGKEYYIYSQEKLSRIAFFTVVFLNFLPLESTKSKK